MNQLISNDEVLAWDLLDLELREHWERAVLARQTALEVSHYRAAHSLSQRELAERLETRHSQIARLEAGEHEPNPSSLARLAAVLGRSPWLTATRSLPVDQP